MLGEPSFVQMMPPVPIVLLIDPVGSVRHDCTCIVTVQDDNHGETLAEHNLKIWGTESFQQILLDDIVFHDVERLRITARCEFAEVFPAAGYVLEEMATLLPLPFIIKLNGTDDRQLNHRRGSECSVSHQVIRKFVLAITGLNTLQLLVGIIRRRRTKTRQQQIRSFQFDQLVMQNTTSA